MGHVYKFLALSIGAEVGNRQTSVHPVLLVTTFSIIPGMPLSYFLGPALHCLGLSWPQSPFKFPASLHLCLLPRQICLPVLCPLLPQQAAVLGRVLKVMGCGMWEAQEL